MWVRALLGGVLLGLISRYTGSLSGPIRWLGNAGAPWLLVAFLVGRWELSARTAARSGALALVAAAISHYLPYRIAAGWSPIRWWVVLWVGFGAVAGALLGYAGWRRDAWSNSFACAAFAAEAILLLLVAPQEALILAVPVEAMIALALPLLSRPRVSRPKTYAVAAILTPVCMVILWLMVLKIGRVYPHL